MRRSIYTTSEDIKIIAYDDEPGIIDSLGVVLKREGYSYDGVTDYESLITRLKKENFDILILDYLLDGKFNGDKIVANLREFSNIYILLLTGHKDLAPPLETLRTLEIQDYCEKGSEFNEVIFKLEVAKKYIKFFRKFAIPEFASIIEFLRKQEGYSQEDFGKKVGLSRNTISDIEKGKYYPRADFVIKMSRVLKVSADYLLGTFIH